MRALERPCGTRATIDALAVGRAQVLIACNDGRLVKIGDDGAAAVIAEVPLGGGSVGAPRLLEPEPDRVDRQQCPSARRQVGDPDRVRAVGDG